jgi:hypothetical protein
MEYDSGFAEIGMEEAYTLRMLADEFRAPTPKWNICPRICYHRDVKGVVIHETEYGEDGAVSPNDEILCLPVKIQEDVGRGTEMCVFIEQFPSGVCTISSRNPPPSASNPECPLNAHFSSLPLITFQVPRSPERYHEPFQ